MSNTIGTIVKGIGGFYYVKASDSIYECKARGVFRKQKITPMIGDRVKINVDGGHGSIVEILPRTSSLIRPPVANIDTMILVTSAASPEPNMLTIDKMLVNAEISNIEPVVCINKIDIDNGEELEKIYSSAGYKVFKVSAQSGIGIEALTEYLAGRTSAFAGLSGVGKSSILSIITEDSLETGNISEKISRGKHTTRHVELFQIKNGGYVLDTPGFSSLEVEGIKAEDLWLYFPEMSDSQNKCRFRGCSHINEPDCFVKDKVETGEMVKSRYENYKELYNKLKTVKEWEKK
ncbi:MAG: ribosome small subunit-dependent GTPase A [Oscillospiraceae bacterium]|nr:ribosome small subunit-dependent GTPase A [Oscillospiraceae bacterium]